MAKKLEIDIIARDKSKQALNQVQGNLQKTKSSVLNLKNALLGLGAGLVVRSIIQTTATFEDLRTSLSSVTGSAKEGAKAFQFITGIATKTQFSVEDLSKSFIKLKAAGIKPTKELLNIFTNTAAITTDQVGSLEAVTDLYARTVSGGLGLEEIQRLGDRGVPILRILEQELNLTRSEISEFGKTAEGAQEIVEAFGRGIQKEFGTATTDLLGNLNVSFSNLGISVRNVQDKIGQGMSPAVKALTDELTLMFEQNEALAISFGKKLGDAVKSITKGFILVKENASQIYDIFALIVALKVAAVFYGIGMAIGNMKIAMIGFNMATKANPIFFGISAFIAGMVLVTQKFRIFKDELKDGSVLSTVTDFQSAEEAVKKLKDQLANLEKQKATALGDTGTEITRDDFGVTVTKVDTSKFDLEIEKTKGMLDAIKILKASYQHEAIEEELNTEKVKDEIKEASFSKDMERLINKSKSEAEQKLIAHQNELMLIEDFLEKEKDLTISQKVELLDTKIALEQQYTDFLDAEYAKRIELEQANIQKQVDLARNGNIKDVNLEKMGTESKEKIAKAGMRSAIEGLAGHNKEMFALNKAFRIKDAVMDTAAGITKALAMGPIGIPLAILLGALGVAQVATIASQQYTGRRTGGQVTGGTPYLVGEQGPELFQPNQSGTIVPNDRLGGGQNINITINANDTQGFDELLIKRRATIVNVINDALNSQGKEALV